jgi:thioredoxin-dependent peroxiredoxin
MFYNIKLCFQTFNLLYCFFNENPQFIYNMTTLKAGDKAPQFSGTDHQGNTISLDDFKGSKLVIYFYPKDSTPGCTAQACNLRDNYDLLLSKGYKVVGVSADDAKSHQKFIDKYELPFPLIADTNKDVINAFQVWGPKKFMGKSYDGIHRTTFVIDQKGIIEEVISDVKTKEHASQLI